MKNIIFAALIGVSAVGVAATTANAAGISISFGNVGTAYSDGYYDNHHGWHAWRAGEWDRYRHDHPGHYNNWGHNDHSHNNNHHDDHHHH